MIKRNVECEVIVGEAISPDVSTVFAGSDAFAIPGTIATGQRRGLFLNQNCLSKHFLLIGGIGTGKTNTMFHLLSQISENLAEDDVALIFDTKGDFVQEFYQDGDVVFSNEESCSFPKGSSWNIFAEIENGAGTMSSINEIAKMLFAEACEKTQQIFFPAAARDIFAAILYHFMQMPENANVRNNATLLKYINQTTSKELRAMLNSYAQFRAMTSYIYNDDSPQTQGVLSELQQVVRQIFIGNFASYGKLGIRDLIHKKGGKRIFIEYDLSIGQTLTPVYSLMFDLAIKEAIGRNRAKGNVYFVTDEFRLLPNLQHIDDAVNFGRSLGVKFLIGIQNVEQIYDNYGEERARSILSGLSTIFAFRVNDAKSREYIKDVFGQNVQLLRYQATIANKGLQELHRDGYVVEDWDILRLEIGEAIIGFSGVPPFKFKFDIYST